MAVHRYHRAIQLFIVAICLVAVGGAITLVGTQVATSAPKPDKATMEAVVTRAIEIDETMTKLPLGAKAGHLTDADRSTLRANIRTSYASVFAGPAFTNRLNGLLTWADRIATDPTQSHVLFSDIQSIRFDDIPAVNGDTITATGVFDVRAQSAWDTTDGITVKDGGIYTNSFAMTLERKGNGNSWFVTSYSISPLDYIPDPALGENLDINPNPEATKPPSGDDAPVIPVDPAPPVP
jgi:hypothetical protein